MEEKRLSSTACIEVNHTILEKSKTKMAGSQPQCVKGALAAPAPGPRHSRSDIGGTASQSGAGAKLYTGSLSLGGDHRWN